MEKPYVTAYISKEVKDRLPELIAYIGAPSVSKLIEVMLEGFIKEMDEEKAA